MTDYSMNEKMILVQYAIKKYENEEIVIEKLKTVLTEKPEYLEKYPIFTAPGLVINGKLEFIGIPKKEDLEKKFSKTR
jgi:hypothetical protein